MKLSRALSFCLTVWLLFICAAAAVAAKKPNVIFI
ncbi:MAG: hypothetical protein ACI8V5_000048, partial [Limisphaerales bacterium]